MPNVAISLAMSGMCGINGVFAYHYAANPIDRSEVERTRDHMRSRGPDGKGLWTSPDERVGFGHRRLSVVDLSEAGAQPMLSTDGNLVVTFNGEIYNYLELRRDLEAQGHVFRSNCDTEALLHLYARKGEAMVHDLRGMFAFAIWDMQKRELFLARDPYGIKPLYYSDDGWTFRFASQVKALLAGGKISREPEPAGHVGFYLWGSIPEPFTAYQAIRALPAGTTMTVTQIGSGKPRSYFSIAQVYAEASASSDQSDDLAQEAITEALRDSVRCHLAADVPVGIFLSAGIDSSALLGIMRDVARNDIQAVTVTFDEYKDTPNDEAPLAAEVSRYYGARHTVRVVTKDEFKRDLPHILEAMDQPSIDGINTWFVSKAAAEHGLKVALSGLGGDELFGGYPSFHRIPNWVRTLKAPSLAPGLGRLLRPMLRPFVTNPKAASMVEYGGTYPGAYLLNRGLFMSWELPDIVFPDFVKQGLNRLKPLKAVQQTIDREPLSSFAKVATLESSLYMRNQLLRDTDWSSMAHSVEVRVPLVDVALLRQTARHQKHISMTGKQTLARSPSRKLPRAITEKKKTGFTTPIETWLSSPQPLHNVTSRGSSRHVAKLVGAAELAVPNC